MEAFGFLDRMLYGNWAGKTGDTVTQTLNLLMIAASLVLFAVSLRRGSRGTAAGSLLALSAVGFLCLSALWSLSPPTTIRTGIIYLSVILGVIGVARMLDADEFMRLLSWCCFLSAIASIFVLFAAPSVAFVQGDNQGTIDFNGIFPHKNFLGQVMAIGALAALHGIRVARRKYLGKLFMLFVFVGMAYASKSTGALLASLLVCGVSGIDSLLRKGGAARWAGLVLAASLAPALIVAVAAPDTFLTLIGKDPTLTGRTEIWAYVTDDIWMKPWFGWGYFGFWQPSNPAALEISDAFHWTVPQAHNGLLELLLNVGVLGTTLFAVILIRTIVLAVRCLQTPHRALAISTISCCLMILLIGVSETVLLAATQPQTPVMFITGLMCERALWVARYQRQRVPEFRTQIRCVSPRALRPRNAIG
jgi:exopolysaccharide production protein ExoQ